MPATLCAHLTSRQPRLSPAALTANNSVRVVLTNTSITMRFSNSNASSSLGRPILKCSVSTVAPPVIDDYDQLKFMEGAKNGNLIPLYRCIFSDQLTPVQAYRCLVKEEDDRYAPSFLIESVEQGYQDTEVGRYSYVGAQPTMEIVAKENSVTILDHIKGTKTEKIVENPMEIPKKLMEEWSPQLLNELPEAFCGGWVGYFSYDAVRYVEKKKLPFSIAPKDDRNLPDISLGLYDDVIVFDHIEKKIYAIHWVRLDHYSSVQKAYNDGMNKLENLASKVFNIQPPKLSAGSVNLKTPHFASASKLTSSMKPEEYKDAIVKAKEHIAAGDIFQIVLSQRFERRTFADPFEVYRALRVVNPSPYLSYIQARGCILVASSPEILTRVKRVSLLSTQNDLILSLLQNVSHNWFYCQQRKNISRPLAGTIRRGKTETEDKMLEKELLADEKECAEHIMLVDLARNDIGKVSKAGTVKVERLMNVERYSHVMHISSTVTGELLEDKTCWDALEAELPLGTVTGAPKFTRRGPYSGGFGYVSYSGDMDIAIAKRTIVFPNAPGINGYKDVNGQAGNSNDKPKKRREWLAHFQVGSGIVADSDPDREQKECENKAAGLSRGIDLAESTFVYDKLGA
ncbi:hypothetical protein MKW94_013169 [Papaver nudicaule]|uniref:Anthranilate synthase n=1 Tax=Papaver nudicaule TaxID=74823 RepID=A0AA41RS68_PAPNU|nr:hypothetical protein [Papaver nudicaule]